MKSIVLAYGIRRGRILASILAAAVLLSANICSNAQSGIIQECRYSLSSNWPSSQHSFDPGNQASCPIHTPPGGRNQDYQANAVLVQGTTAGGGSLEFLNYHGNAVTQSGSVLYSCCDIYVFTGSYTAGTVAAPDTTIYYDIALNSIALSPSFGGGVATVNARLGYQTTAPAAVMGVATIDPSQTATLSGEFYQSDLVPPVSYQWYRDGSAISGATDATVNISGGSPNTTDTYEFVVTDSQNRSVGATHDVFTTAGCGTQFIC